ncbi:hypothetical protein RF11_07295 [Thelohanellus kitauei]|uniref:Uncharacterized protein n=1 Tax=Thelohanellus kitauei TaxID=669202 RepID=A0A0C2JJY2_THEKT|nr:hypothetical protein RF11_07295 [Thelohanellus kitauei]
MIKSHKKLLLAIVIVIAEIAISISLPLWIDSLDSSTWDSKDGPTPGNGRGAFTIVIITTLAQLLWRLTICVFFGKFKEFHINRCVIMLSIMSFSHHLITPYVSGSQRNLPSLQAVMLNFQLPVTLLIRLFWFKKVPSKKKFIFVIFVIIGLILSTFPEIITPLLRNKSLENHKSQIYSFHSITWSFVYVIFVVVSFY